MSRGATLIEVMIALSILLVAMVGFAATLNLAARSTALGHRRTTTTFLRGGLIDRVMVTPRAALASLPAAWTIDSCYDVNGQPIASNPAANAGSYVGTFVCPTTGAIPVYRSWIRATPNPGFVNWAVSLYVERIDSGCTSALRDAAEGCSTADLLLTD